VALQPGEVIMLENVRFHADEEKNGGAFARSLAYLAELYVDDAFGTAHRAHASTAGVAKFLPAVAGLLLEKEVENLGKLLHDPAKPYAAVLGGAKVSDKIKVIENLLPIVDYCLIGGGIAATFLKAAGHQAGNSRTEDDQLEYVNGLLKQAKGAAILTPSDLVVADAFSADALTKTVDSMNVPHGWYIMDIGPQTVARYVDIIAKCRTVVWNGPMGVFEMPRFAAGTVGVAKAIAALNGKAVTVVGGGSTAEAANKLGLADKVTHISTGGGASLEFLEGRPLPGIEVLQNK
jgi:phosphoglycerate kinase